MPWAALSEIALLVTTWVPGMPPRKRMAASLFVMAGYAHESLPDELVMPAYFTCVKSILLRGSGAPANQMPSQSPAAGGPAPDEKRLGCAAGPPGAGARWAGSVGSAGEPRRRPPALKSIV